MVGLGENIGRCSIGKDRAVQKNHPIGMGGGGFDIVGDQEDGEVMDPA